jgi:hypothetical protein
VLKLIAHLAAGVLTHGNDTALAVHNHLRANVHRIRKHTTTLSFCSSGASAGDIHRQPVSRSSRQHPLALSCMYKTVPLRCHAGLLYSSPACPPRLIAICRCIEHKPDCSTPIHPAPRLLCAHLKIVWLRPCHHGGLNGVIVKNAEAPMPADAASFRLVGDTPPATHTKRTESGHTTRC